MAKLSLLMQQTEWFSQVRAWPSVKIFTKLGGIGLLLFFYSNTAYAADIATILANVRRVIVPLTSLALAVSFVIGMAMIFSALIKMKKFGAMQSMMTQPGEIQGPLITMVIGAMLIYLPTSTDYLMNSIFSTSNSLFGGGGIDYSAFGQGASLLGYSGSGGGFGQQWSDLANTLVLFIQFIGFLSFIKGLLLMQKAAAPGHQPGTFSKGLTHLIGGVILINFIGAVNVLRNTIFGS